MQVKSPAKIKILIVDDSLTSQKLYRHIIAADSRFEIVFVASNGREAIEYVALHKPDVVSMDINMPLMDGLEATRHIMQTNPVPIVIVSSLYEQSKLEMAMEVLEAGAVSILPKPFGPGHPEHVRTAQKYLMMLKSMAEIKVVRRRPYLIHKNDKGNAENITKHSDASLPDAEYRLLVIGASAGGPESLKTILNMLHTGFPLPIMIVQHIDKHFAESYRLWLQSYSSIPILLATDDQLLLPGHVYLAPGDKHLIVKSEGLAGLSNEAPVKGHRPSVGYLFSSACRIYGNKVIAVILSGMGNDGAQELKMLKDIGALTIGQNEASCLVYGMPGAAARLGALTRTLAPKDMAQLFLYLLKY